MTPNENLRLFDKGTATEIKLFFLLIFSVAFILLDILHFATPFRNTVSQVISPLREFVLLPRKGVEKISVWSNAVSRAYDENIEILQEKIQLSKLETSNELLRHENEELKRLLGLKQNIDYPSLPVEVLYTAPNLDNHIIMINEGSSKGIEVGMPVIDEGGVVGQVRLVNVNSAEVLLLTDRRMSVPVLNVRNNFRTIVFGGADDGQMEIRYLTDDSSIRVGDRLVTSGIGGVYPASLSVGVVQSIQASSEQGYARISVKPSAEPYYFRHFLVLLVPNLNNKAQGEE